MTIDITLPGIIRALGRGKKGSRDLTREEARFTMQATLSEVITPAQLGAFLMLMRVKEETSEEIAGMVEACHQELGGNAGAAIDVNWPAYAGKKKQPSWYLLAARLLADNGVRILIHGGGEHTAGRQYAKTVCHALNIPVVTSLDDARRAIESHQIAYIGIADFLPVISGLIDMKAELGLRSPVNTLVRHLNPLNAHLTVQGMFHPPYMAIHHHAAQALNQHCNIVLKGDGGEFEVRPDSETRLMIHAPEPVADDALPPVLRQRALRPEQVELEPLRQLWDGQCENEYGTAATLQTAALVLAQRHTMPLSEAKAQVQAWWLQRRPL